MALLYKKRIEGNTAIYDFTVKTRWIVILAIVVGFVMFMVSIKAGSSANYGVPMFLISLPVLFLGLGFAVVESMIFSIARAKAAHATIIKKGVIKLEGQMSQQ